jgi:hypothetical protein
MRHEKINNFKKYIQLWKMKVELKMGYKILI